MANQFGASRRHFPPRGVLTKPPPAKALLNQHTAAAKHRLLVPRRAARPQPTVPRRPADEPVPLSFSQEQMWLHGELAPEVPLYTESLTIHRHGPLDAEAFAASFDEIIRRHDIWRTTFEWSNGQVIQQARKDCRPRVQFVDLRSLPSNEREVAALQMAM